MNSDVIDLLRLLHNLIRIGTIDGVSGNKARVKLAPDLYTDWIKWITMRAGDARTWWVPSVGEQVLVLSPGGELGLGTILPGISSANFPEPDTDPHHHTVRYSDGAVIQYDSQAHALTATLPAGTAKITADKVTSNAPKTICTGDLIVAKNVIVQQNMTVMGASALNGGVNVQGGETGGAAMIVKGIIRSTMDILAGSISLRKHPHSNVKRGDEQSGGPL